MSTRDVALEQSSGQESVKQGGGGWDTGHMIETLKLKEGLKSPANTEAPSGT